MPQTRPFGRRVSDRDSLPVARLPRAEPAPALRETPPEPPPVAQSEPTAAPPILPEPKSVEQELAEWNEARKIRKRSFREPWRSVSIVAGLGFLATSWLLPDAVSTVAEVALGVLSAGSFYAGWRARKSP